jgi:uncharacterized membrane protein YraQ (UPF0718 family)
MGGNMVEYFKKHRTDIMIFVLFIIFILISYIFNFSAGIKIIGNFKGFFIEMVSFLPLMFILIGLFDVWVPKERIEKHIGKSSGFTGSLWVILLAMLQAGPLYGAFPVSFILWKKGASIRNIFIYIGAFSTLKIPMLGFEISFLGIKFSLMRAVITLPVFIIISLIMDLYLNNKNFEVKDGSK